jgi:hypothetical protein
VQLDGVHYYLYFLGSPKSGVLKANPGDSFDKTTQMRPNFSVHIIIVIYEIWSALPRCLPREAAFLAKKEREAVFITISPAATSTNHHSLSTSTSISSLVAPPPYRRRTTIARLRLPLRRRRRQRREAPSPRRITHPRPAATMAVCEITIPFCMVEMMMCG